MAGGLGGEPGGIVGLLDLIEEHRGPLEYDWRARFGLPLSVVGTDAMTWGEAARLVTILASDPSSMTAASVGGWDYPTTREALVMMDLFDLQHMSKSKKKPKPYPRPWKAAAARTRVGRTSMTTEQIDAVLRRHGHDL